MFHEKIIPSCFPPTRLHPRVGLMRPCPVPGQALGPLPKK